MTVKLSFRNLNFDFCLLYSTNIYSYRVTATPKMSGGGALDQIKRFFVVVGIVNTTPIPALTIPEAK